MAFDRMRFCKEQAMSNVVYVSRAHIERREGPLRVFLGIGLSLLMRIHLVWPGAHIPFASGLATTRARGKD
jgi:hypothetical protein